MTNTAVVARATTKAEGRTYVPGTSSIINLAPVQNKQSGLRFHLPYPTSHLPSRKAVHVLKDGGQVPERSPTKQTKSLLERPSLAQRHVLASKQRAVYMMRKTPSKSYPIPLSKKVLVFGIETSFPLADYEIGNHVKYMKHALGVQSCCTNGLLTLSPHGRVDTETSKPRLMMHVHCIAGRSP